MRPKHLAGLLLLPRYPFFANPEPNKVKAFENPIKKGPNAGPKAVAFRGSRPRPNARNKMNNDVIVSKTYASPGVTRVGST